MVMGTKGMRWACFGAGVVISVAALVGCNLPVQQPPGPVVTVLPGITWASPMPTPASRLDTMPPGALVTVRQVGSIPPNTPVQIGGSMFENGQYTYTIMTIDQLQSASATDADLTFAPGYTPGMPMPVARYKAPGFWTECYPLVTTEALQPEGTPSGPDGLVPAGTRVRVGSMWGTAVYLGNGRWTWFYNVVAANPTRGMLAREDQLLPAPGVAVQDMNQPTPPQPYAIQGGYSLVTRVDVGDIPAGTPVSVVTTHMGCDEWMATITTQDGRTAEALFSQLAPIAALTPTSMP